MNVLMFTNTYKPHVGGVANSVGRLSKALRERGHRVVVVAPEFENTPGNEIDVIRVPAVQNFNGSDFSLTLPVPFLNSVLPESFHADIVHAHHPYLLGDTALRHGSREGCPVVFTHHTMYEEYTHYVPGDSENMKRFVVELSTGYANMADAVIAPSDSVRATLVERGVETGISVIPTGLEREKFKNGDGRAARERAGIPNDAFVVGHVGRLAPEKNLDFLARAVCRFLQDDMRSWFLVVGNGPSYGRIGEIAQQQGLDARVRFTGSLSGQELVDAYQAMDLFAFASKSETQGMVLTEAMASGLPVVAVDAPGVREVVRDRENGRLLSEEHTEQFKSALKWTRDRLQEDAETFAECLRSTIDEFSVETTTGKTIELYTRHLQDTAGGSRFRESEWERLLGRIGREWELWSNRLGALSSALLSKDQGTE